MSKKHLSLKPNDISDKSCWDDIWFYEENNGLHVFVSDENKPNTQFIIPVASIRAYLKRKDK